MPLPFLPAGESELPGQRFVLFADRVNQVQKMDESIKTADGTTFEGKWVSPALTRGNPLKLWTLLEVQIWYIAEVDTTILVEGSPNGGDTWTISREVSLVGGSDELRTKHIYINVTGDDLRVRFRFNNDPLVKILGWSPNKLVQRGDVRYA